MDAFRTPARWLAILRIITGAWFVKSLWTKLVLVGGFLPIPVATERWRGTMVELISRFAREHPVGWYKEFLEQTVVGHAPLFANLTAIGESFVGLGLVFGVLTVPSAAVGLMLVLMYGFATMHLTPAQQGFHWLLFFLMLAFLFGKAGEEWGVDGWWKRRRAKSN